MKIVEPDCFIEYKNGSYNLYVLKTKKELKEDSDDQFKIRGYYQNLDSAFKEIIRFRQNKKYPFKEEWINIKQRFNIYLNTKKNFKQLISKIYEPIIKFKKEMFKY